MKYQILVLALCIIGALTAKTPVYTVFVHGTRAPEFIDKHVPIAHNFCSVDLGMNKGTEISKQYHLAKVLPKVSATDPEEFPLDNLYTYGWSGKLSSAARLEAAEDLYEALTKLRKTLPRRARLRLVTHSHGGSVALDLARVEKKRKKGLVIDQLVLLAVPVQQLTAGYIARPLFKEVISLYSTGDVLQIIDPQGLHKKVKKSKPNTKKLFSGRVFEPHDKLIQRRIRSKGRDILHTEFICTDFMRQLPRVLKKIEQDKGTVNCDASSACIDIGHLEGV